MKMMDDSNGRIEPKRGRLPAVVVLAAIPIAWYTIVFLYEYGKCAYFNVPAEFVRVDLTTGFVVAIALGAALNLFIWPALIAYSTALDQQVSMRMRVPMAMGLIALVLVTLLFRPIAFIIAVVVVVLAISRQANKSPQPAEQRMNTATEQKTSVLAFATGLFGKESFGVFFMYVFALLIAYNFGYAAALGQRVFLTSDNFAVVAIFGNSLIGMEEHRVANGPGKDDDVALGPALMVMRTDAEAPIILRQETFHDVLIDGKKDSWYWWFWKF